MFIRKIKNPTGQTYYHIVESYREGKKVRQRTLLSLGRIEDGNLEALVQSAGRHLDILTASQLAKELSTEELQHIYRTMDLLCSHKGEIEKSLYWHGRDLFNLEVDIVLYDLTTLRFESTRTDLGELRQFGYSKERRSDCTQVVFGLLVDRDGIPLGFEVYPGNTFEGKTLSDIVDKMKKKFKVRRFIFVADRGLLSRGNIEKLGEDKGEFIVGMKLGSLAEKKLMFKSPALGKSHVKPRPLSVVEAMQSLKEVRAIPVKIRDQIVWTRTDVTGNALALFRAARVGLPPKILKTHRM